MNQESEVTRIGKRFFVALGAAGLVGISVALAAKAWDWSPGVVFATLLVCSLTISVVTLRKILFEPGKRRRHRGETPREVR